MADLHDSVSSEQQPSKWTDSERRTSMAVLFVSFAMMSAGRGSLPITVVQMAEEFHWDKRTIGMILSSFYWGYIITQIIGGWLSDRYGGLVVHWVFGVGWSCALLAIALLADISQVMVLGANFVFGACQGVFFPSVINILTSKVPHNKRSFVYSKMGTGSQVGSISIGFLGSFFLYPGGWRYVFIITGLSSLGSVALVVWLSRRSTSDYERVDKGSGQETVSNGVSKSAKPVPWLLLFREKAVLALFACHFSQGFFDKTMNWTPTYFNDIFPEMKANAWIYNVTPRLFYAMSAFLGGWMFERLISNGVSVTTGRKVMEFLSLCVGGSFLLLIALANVLGNTFFLSLLLMSFAYFFRGFEVAGSTLNPTDLAPSFSGLLYGMMNTMAAIAAVVGVYLAGQILHATDNWSLVYLMVGLVCYFGISVYACFGSGNRLTIDS